MDLTPNLKFRSSVNVDLALGSQKIFFPTFDLALFPGDPNRPATEFREVNSLTRAENKARKCRLQRLGNSVLPSMVSVAFQCLVSGFEPSVRERPKKIQRRSDE